jgi:hypothetical protein
MPFDLPVQIREVNLSAMRAGPGKHLKGLTLLGGVVKPEEARHYFWPYMHVLTVTSLIISMRCACYVDSLALC